MVQIVRGYIFWLKKKFVNSPYNHFMMKTLVPSSFLSMFFHHKKELYTEENRWILNTAKNTRF